MNVPIGLTLSSRLARSRPPLAPAERAEATDDLGSRAALLADRRQHVAHFDKLNEMDALRWTPAHLESVLDLGCNIGELLSDLREAYPNASLVGVDVHAAQLVQAKSRFADVEFVTASGDALPFDVGSFDCVTCVEVLEHIPFAQRSVVLQEIRRVIRRGGRLILRVPHAGAFAWLDSNNMRFRFPWLYRMTVGRGLRDVGYGNGSTDVIWHHHFTKSELLELAGPGWTLIDARTGGLFLLPLMDLVSWPFYRLGLTGHPLYRLVQRVARFDIGRDYGRWSFDILLILHRV